MIHVISELAALIAAEERDEANHAFDDLECFYDDPDTHAEYRAEYCRRSQCRFEINRSLNEFGFDSMFYFWGD